MSMTAVHALGDHRCTTYRSLAERERLAQQWFALGLHTDEKLVYVADGEIDGDPIAEWLEARVPSERLSIAHVTDIYPASGVFDGPATVETFRQLAAEARSQGWSTLRAMADLTKLAADPEVVDDLINYELLIDAAVEEEGLHGLCVYDRSIVHEHVPGLVATHPADDGPAGRPAVWVRNGVLRLRGELDLLGLDSVESVLAAAPTDVQVVSLDGLDFLDVTGGRALFDFAGERRLAGRPVEFAGASRTVNHVLGVYGLSGE